MSQSSASYYVYSGTSLRRGASSNVIVGKENRRAKLVPKQPLDELILLVVSIGERRLGKQNDRPRPPAKNINLVALLLAPIPFSFSRAQECVFFLLRRTLLPNN